MDLNNKTKWCSGCQQEKALDQFYFHKTGRKKGSPLYYCKICNNKRKCLWEKDHPGHSAELKHLRGLYKPMAESKNCAQYLGVVVAEKALSKFFNNITRMPNGNQGFDFLCEKGFKIDVKSGCLIDAKCSHWHFSIFKNKIANYFLLLAFDSRESLEPQHVWLVPGNVINNKGGIAIYNTKRSLAKWSQYEKPLDRVIACCNLMKTKKL